MSPASLTRGISLSNSHMKLFCLCLLLVCPLLASANYEANVSQQGWIDRSGKPIANSDNIKSVKGFGGWLIITPDSDWYDKWNTPSDTTPYFSEASSVAYGQNLTILTFYINPLLDKAGNANIACSIKITRPGGSIAIDDQNIPCVSGRFNANPRSVHLSPVVIKYHGDDGDPAGKWRVQVTLTDNNRNATVTLFNSFTLTTGKTKASGADSP